MPDTQVTPPPPRDYRATVFLPETAFPMRGDLPKREPGWLARWDAIRLRDRLRAASAGRPRFVLHDGPPYANGPLHIGHALNKILKDVINRAAQMSGYDADYIPGWDCHGLPIEWKVEEDYRSNSGDKDAIPVLDFRAECRAYAAKWLDVQRDEFQRLGVLGDWADPYATMNFPSEAAIVAEIGKFLMNGSLFRGLRPVMWSPVEKTALAEAEIEYHDHVSPTLWARFPLLTGALAGASVVIWTTTPWTIPGNRAVAYGADIDYALVHVEGLDDGSHLIVGETLLVALARLPEFARDTRLGAHSVQRLLKGAELAGATAAHPLRGWPTVAKRSHASTEPGGDDAVAREPGSVVADAGERTPAIGYAFPVPLLPGDFVTTDAGTGFVHIAPGHGEDDFALGRVHGIEVPETVHDDGTFTAHAPGFKGLHVFRAHAAIFAACEAAGTLVAKGKLTHSYPHSWRSKAPVIFRATPQWFIALDDANAIRAKALDAIEATRFIPEAGRNRLASMVAARPDWCISRQRAWGVPIAVFVHRATGQVLRDEAVMRRIVDVFTTEGADAWYAPDAAQRFLGAGYDAAEYEQVRDIVDVWFESGSTHAFVLEARGLPLPADLYLEGSDQHRGWFQSSLLESVGTRGVAPFKAVLTHGFVLDEGGRKMSKSLGNTTAPQQIVEQYGADLLRLWVMQSDTAEDLRIGPEILKQTAELYRRLRNTLRWLLGSLAGYTEAEAVPHEQLPELERWVLHRLSELDTRIRGAVASHDWTGVYPELHNFCATDLSAFYFDIRKDALYCDAPDSLRRRSARTVLDALHRCLVAWLAPVLVFTADEAWLERFPSETDSVHLRDFSTIPVMWRDDALAARWARIRAIRSDVTAVLEHARAEKQIGSSLQAAPTLLLDDHDARLLASAEWAEICIVSVLDVGRASMMSSGGPPAVGFALAPGSKCERCWRVLPEVGTSAAHPTLCRRCDAVVARRGD